MKTNRRNFFKTLVGFFTLPAGLSLAKLSKQKPKQIKSQYEKFNPNNLKCDGTFEQWVKSIAQEVKRLLAIKSNEPDAHWYLNSYAVKVKHHNCSTQDGDVPTLTVEIYLGELLRLEGYFSFVEIEWERNHKCSEMLQKLAYVRFIDCIWSMYHSHRGYYLLLKKFGINPSIYIH